MHAASTLTEVCFLVLKLFKSTPGICFNSETFQYSQIISLYLNNILPVDRNYDAGSEKIWMILFEL